MRLTASHSVCVSYTMCSSIKVTVLNHSTVEVLDTSMGTRLGRFDEQLSDWFEVRSRSARLRFQTFGNVSLFILGDNLNLDEEDVDVSVVKGSNSRPVKVDAKYESCIGISKVMRFNDATEWLDGSTMKFRVKFKNITFSTFDKKRDYRWSTSQIANLDTTLITSCGRKILASKQLLVNLSPVFAAMFRHDMLERSSGQIAIPDIEFDVLRKLIYIMSTGDAHIDNLDSALELFVAANKYQVRFIELICEDFIVDNISQHNVMHLLSFAHVFGSKALITASLDFMVRQSDKISKLPSFDLLNCDVMALIVDNLRARIK